MKYSKPNGGLSCGYLPVGVDSFWEQDELEATLREMLENAAREASHMSNVCFVGQLCA